MKDKSTGQPEEDDLDSMYRRSEELDVVLVKDLAEAKRYLETSSSQFARRVYCRTVMSLLEGISNDLKAHVLTFHEFQLGQDEIDDLKRRSGALQSAFD